MSRHTKWKACVSGERKRIYLQHVRVSMSNHKTTNYDLYDIIHMFNTKIVGTTMTMPVIRYRTAKRVDSCTRCRKKPLRSVHDLPRKRNKRAADTLWCDPMPTSTYLYYSKPYQHVTTINIVVHILRHDMRLIQCSS